MKFNRFQRLTVSLAVGLFIFFWFEYYNEVRFSPIEWIHSTLNFETNEKLRCLCAVKYEEYETNSETKFAGGVLTYDQWELIRGNMSVDYLNCVESKEPFLKNWTLKHTMACKAELLSIKAKHPNQRRIQDTILAYITVGIIASLLFLVSKKQ